LTRAGATGISRERIAHEALAIIDREGVDGLTMRRLADRLGVGTMTLYGYVRNKEELLDAAVDAAVDPAVELSSAGSWREQLRVLINTARGTLSRHPALVRIRLSQPVLRPEALRFGEAGVSILLAAGFGAPEAAQAFRLLFTYTFGFAGLSPASTTDQARRQADAALALLPPDTFPTLTATREHFSRAMAGGEAFDYGLERILDGLDARLHELSSGGASAP
jgi:AcrR family transcriptional regulator